MALEERYLNPSPDCFTKNDQAFVVGDSPVTYDVNTVLGKNGANGFIDNTGTGDLKYSYTDGTGYCDDIYLPAGAIDSLFGLSIDSIKVTYVADTKYGIRIT